VSCDPLQPSLDMTSPLGHLTASGKTWSGCSRGQFSAPSRIATSGRHVDGEDQDEQPENHGPPPPGPAQGLPGGFVEIESARGRGAEDAAVHQSVPRKTLMDAEILGALRGFGRQGASPAEVANQVP